MNNIKLFERALLETWLHLDNRGKKETILKWVDFYEKETGHKIDKMRFELDDNGENFMMIMNQIQSTYKISEEIKRIKSLL